MNSTRSSVQVVEDLSTSEATLSPSSCCWRSMPSSHNTLFPSFLDYSTIFNGNVVTAAKAVVCPVDAEDVSRFVIKFSAWVIAVPKLAHGANVCCRVVLFCNRHSLSLSVKAGGYGTAGWAIAGDIIIDLSKLVEVDIEIPKEDGSFTSLKDVAAANSKGKNPVSGSNITGKRRREEDSDLRHYDAASTAVAQFLDGPMILPPFTISDNPPPSAKRRVHPPSPPPQQSSQPSRRNPAPSSRLPAPEAVPPPLTIASLGPPPGRVADTANLQTSVTSVSAARHDADPFGYLDAPTKPPVLPPSTVQSFQNPHARLNIWGTANPNPLLTGTSDTFAQMNVFSEIEPPHHHVFVTFGSGMRQKEIDTYTAKNPLEVTYPSGNGSTGIPYHVPL